LVFGLVLIGLLTCTLQRDIGNYNKDIERDFYQFRRLLSVTQKALQILKDEREGSSIEPIRSRFGVWFFNRPYLRFTYVDAINEYVYSGYGLSGIIA